MILSEPRYEIRDLLTKELLAGVYHYANVAPEIRHQRRLGRRPYFVDTQAPPRPDESDPCGQCNHVRGRHYEYFEPGEAEAWSWCEDCGGRCEFAEAVA